MYTELRPRAADPNVAWFGPLSTSVLSSVLKTIISQKKTGDLQAMIGRAIKTVHFDEGSVVFAVSNVKRERLGETMLATGRISDDDFALASSLMDTYHSRFGQALVRAGLISETELAHQVERHVHGIASSVFGARRGVYCFDERPSPIPDSLAVRLSTGSILLESVRRAVDADTRSPDALCSNPELRAVAEFPGDLEVTDLDTVEANVLCVAGPGKALETIVQQTGLARQRVLRACFTLLAVGLLESDGPLSAIAGGKSSSAEAPALKPTKVSLDAAPEIGFSLVSVEPSAPEASDENEEVVLETDDATAGEIASSPERKAQLLRDVKLHFQVREWDGAIRLLEELIELDPATPNHHAMLGDAKSHLVAHLDDAEAHFVEAIRLEPKNAALHFQMAVYYERAGKPSRARAALKTALRFDPKHQKARQRLARASGSKKSMRTVITSFFK